MSDHRSEQELSLIQIAIRVGMAFALMVMFAVGIFRVILFGSGRADVDGADVSASTAFLASETAIPASPRRS